MTSIKKLQIVGIRSYDPYAPANVEFYKPLTLIVGANGSGKTTIIECLRAACTGELPPNCRQGRTFVHDPRVVGESEIKASIKVKFDNVAGNEVVVSRAYQLSMRGGESGSFKTLEGSLKIWNRVTHQEESMSHRCADLNSLVPQLLGVAKPILDNVVFCHQDESLWPMSDDTTLKKKFDDIFAATRYTQALKAINEYKRDATHRLAVLKEEMNTCAAQKQHATDLRKALTEKQQQVTKLTQELDQLEQQHVTLKTQLDKLKETEAAVTSLSRTQTEIERETALIAKDLEHVRKEMRSRIEENSPGELEMLQRTAEAEIERLQQQLQQASSQQQRSVEGLSKRLQTLRRERDQALDDVARLKHGARALENELKHRDELVLSLSTKLGIALSSSMTPLTPAAITQFQSRLDNLSETELRKTETNKQTRQKRVENVREQLNQKIAERKLRAEKLQALKEELRSAEDQLAQCRDFATLHSQNLSKLQQAEKSLKQLEDALAGQQQDNTLTSKRQTIDTSERQLKVLEAQRNALISDMSDAAESEQRVAVLREKEGALQKRIEKRDMLLAECGAPLARELGCSVGEIEFEAAVEQLQSIHNTTTTELTRHEQTASSLRARVEMLNEQRAKNEQQIAMLTEQQKQELHAMELCLAQLSDYTGDVCTAANVAVSPSACVRLKEVVAQKLKESEQIGGMKVHYEACLPDLIQQARENEHNACPLCTRAMNTHQLQQLETHVTAMLAGIRRARVDAEECTALEADVKVLEEVCRLWDRHELTLEKLEEAIATNAKNSDLSSVQANLAKLEQQIAVERRRKTTQTQLLSSAQQLASLASEVAEFEREVSQTRSAVVSSACGSVRSLKEIVEEKDQLDVNIEAKKRELAKAQRDLARVRDGISDLEKQVNDKRVEMLSLKEKVSTARSGDSQISELELKRDKTASAITQQNSSLQLLQAEISQLDQQFKAEQADCQAANSEESHKLETVKKRHKKSWIVFWIAFANNNPHTMTSNLQLQSSNALVCNLPLMKRKGRWVKRKNSSARLSRIFPLPVKTSKTFVQTRNSMNSTHAGKTRKQTCATLNSNSNKPLRMQLPHKLWVLEAWKNSSKCCCVLGERRGALGI